MRNLVIGSCISAIGGGGRKLLCAPTPQEGATAIFETIEGRAAGVLTVADPVKPITAQALVELRELGVNVLMLTGDNPRTAEAEFGLGHWQRTAVTASEIMKRIQLLKKPPPWTFANRNGITRSRKMGKPLKTR